MRLGKRKDKINFGKDLKQVEEWVKLRLTKYCNCTVNPTFNF